MLFGSILGAIIGVVIATLVSALVFWVVGKLNLGITLTGFRAAFITAFIVAVLWAFASWLWNLIGYQPAGSLTGAITHLILTAGFLYAIRNSVSGLEVKGWGGALIAATGVAVITWLLNLVFGAAL